MNTYNAWTDVPTHLMTRNHLAQRGLKPSGEAVAIVRWGGDKQAQLFDANTAEKRMGEPGPEEQAEIRLQAARTALEWYQGPPAYIIDTETTGVGDDAEICDIAVIWLQTGDVLINTLIKPSQPIPEEATAVHGIANEDVVEAPTFADIAEALRLFRDQGTMIAWNAPFDQSIVDAAMVAAGYPADTHEWRCAMRLHARFFGEWNDWSDDYKWQRLEGSHRALGDCIETRNRIIEMCIEAAAEQGRQLAEEIRAAVRL